MFMIWSQLFLIISASLSHFNYQVFSFLPSSYILQPNKASQFSEYSMPIWAYNTLHNLLLRPERFFSQPILNLFNLFSFQISAQVSLLLEDLYYLSPESGLVAPIICPVSDYFPISILFFHCLYTGLDSLSNKHNLCLLKDSLVIHPYTCSIYHCAQLVFIRCSINIR